MTKKEAKPISQGSMPVEAENPYDKRDPFTGRDMEPDFSEKLGVDHMADSHPEPEEMARAHAVGEEPVTIPAGAPSEMDVFMRNFTAAGKEVKQYFMEILNETMSKVPGFKATMRAQEKRDQRQTNLSIHLDKYKADHPDEELVTVVLTGEGGLGNAYNSRYVRLRGVGEHPGIPRSLAESMVRTHGDAFKIKGGSPKKKGK